ncbi:MAG: hypothetical protein C0524_00610 [Rhodobacter sp.]|nr:hypothetical protein [Rhodobacter sp.]
MRVQIGQGCQGNRHQAAITGPGGKVPAHSKGRGSSHARSHAKAPPVPLRSLAPILALAGSELSRLTDAARGQVGGTVTYDPSRATLAFPGGDLHRDRGVGTDEVIRAPRDGWGVDPQLDVNRDTKAEFPACASHWGLSGPDDNIGAGAREEDILFTYPMTGHYHIGAAEAKRIKTLP